MKLRTELVALLACTLALSACVTKYPEPQSGDRARLRMARTGPSESTEFSVYPASNVQSCYRQEVGQGDQRLALLDNPLVHYDTNLGIPGRDASGKSRSTEAYIRAGEPFLLSTLIMAMTTSTMYRCSIGALWTPIPGADYEATVDWTYHACKLVVTKIEPGSDNAPAKLPVDARYIRPCKDPAK